MAKFYSHGDLLWSKEEDYVIVNGDIGDTRMDQFGSLKQEIRTRVTGALEDWQLYPSITAGLEELIGKPNNPATGKLLEDRAIRVLTFDGFLMPEDVTVIATPLSEDTIMIKVTVQAIDLFTERERSVSLLFDYAVIERNPSIISLN